MPRAQLIRRLRPIENMSVKVLTDARNAMTIQNMADIQPGDVIRTLNGHHIVIITEVGFGQHDVPLYLKFVNSTEDSGVRYGIVDGRITITNPGKRLIDQLWSHDQLPGTWTYENAKTFPDDTRVVRLNALVQ